MHTFLTQLARWRWTDSRFTSDLIALLNLTNSMEERKSLVRFRYKHFSAAGNARASVRSNCIVLFDRLSANVSMIASESIEEKITFKWFDETALHERSNAKLRNFAMSLSWFATLLRADCKSTCYRRMSISNASTRFSNPTCHFSKRPLRISLCCVLLPSNPRNNDSRLFDWICYICFDIFNGTLVAAVAAAWISLIFASSSKSAIAEPLFPPD